MATSTSRWATFLSKLFQRHGESIMQLFTYWLWPQLLWAIASLVSASCSMSKTSTNVMSLFFSGSISKLIQNHFGSYILVCVEHYKVLFPRGYSWSELSSTVSPASHPPHVGPCHFYKRSLRRLSTLLPLWQALTICRDWRDKIQRNYVGQVVFFFARASDWVNCIDCRCRICFAGGWWNNLL